MQEFEVLSYDDKVVKEICYHCGSKTAKASYNYFRRLIYVGGSKVWSKVWSKDGRPIGFYLAMRARDHIRLIEIAVMSDCQGQGYGRMMLYDLLKSMKVVGLNTLTMRTPINETAIDFWVHMGAKITGLKQEDYTLEICIL